MMKSHLLFWAIIFGLGALVGNRYGVPGIVTGVTDRGFEMVESWFGGMGESLPADEEDEGAGDEGAADVDDEGDGDNDTYSAAPSSPAPAPAYGDLGNAANAGLRINEAGLNIIKESEGLRLEAYNLGGRWYIGYGHSRTAKAGMKITETQANQLLREDVRASEDGVRKSVLVPVNENQFSAMVSLAYNLGIGGFNGSSILSEINDGDYQGAANAFLKYNKAGGAVNEHLSQRREKERTLFLKPA